MPSAATESAMACCRFVGATVRNRLLVTVSGAAAISCGDQDEVAVDGVVTAGAATVPPAAISQGIVQIWPFHFSGKRRWFRSWTYEPSSSAARTVRNPMRFRAGNERSWSGLVPSGTIIR